MAHKLHEMLEKIEKALDEQLNHGIEQVDTDEFGKVADIYKDLMCAKKDYWESHYYCSLVDAMDEAEPKEIMDMYERMNEDSRNSKRFYDNYRYKNGRFAPKGRGSRRNYDEPNYHLPLEMYRNYNPEELRDMDRKNGIMYYTENPNMSQSRYESAKRNYTEAKEKHKSGSAEDKQITMKEAEKMLNVIFDEIDEMLEDSTPEMRSMVKTKAMARMQKIQ